MRIDLAKKAFKDLYVNKGLHGCNAHFDWFVKTYSNLLASDMGKEDPEAWREEYRVRQDAGETFEMLVRGAWLKGIWNFETEPKDEFVERIQSIRFTIIGDIESREVEI